MIHPRNFDLFQILYGNNWNEIFYSKFKKIYSWWCWRWLQMKRKLWNLNWNRRPPWSTHKIMFTTTCLITYECLQGLFKGESWQNSNFFYDFGFMQNIMMRLIGCHRKFCILLSRSKDFNHNQQLWFLILSQFSINYRQNCFEYAINSSFYWAMSIDKVWFSPFDTHPNPSLTDNGWIRP